MEEGRLLRRSAVVVGGVPTQLNVECQVQRKLDGFFVFVSRIPVILIVSQHQAIADNLLPSIHERNQHLAPRSFFNIDEEVELRAAMRCLEGMVDTVWITGFLETLPSRGPYAVS
jgi:hypothetical protein